MSVSYKQITFDIDTKVAKQIAGHKYTQMYQIIQSFMKRNKFNHPQGSVYVSTRPMSYTDIVKLFRNFIHKYPYIAKAIRDINVTNVTKTRFSLNSEFTYTGHADEYADYYKTHDINDKNKTPQR